MKRRKFLKTIGTTAVAATTIGLNSCNLFSRKDNTSVKVYMTKDISGKGLLAIYRELEKERLLTGKVAIKMHWGEPGNVNYLRPEIVHDLCMAVNGTLVDSNVYYEGPRQTAEGNRQAALDHGFTFAPVDILDEDGEIRLPIDGGKQVTEAIFGSRIMNYDSIISLSHFKGHGMAGFGGTFKNLAIGIASVAGKQAIHTNGTGSDQWSCTGEPFFEKIIEYNKALLDEKRDKMLYINVLNNLSTSCDCDAHAPLPSMPDIGILASTDPVALDKASLDQIYARPKAERRELVERIESCGGGYQVIYAEKMGLGSQQYKLINI